MRTVRIEGVGVVAFPESASEEEVWQAAGRSNRGYRRVAGFFTNRYTNRSRHTGTAFEPTNSAMAIKCKSMRVGIS